MKRWSQFALFALVTSSPSWFARPANARPWVLTYLDGPAGYETYAYGTPRPTLSPSGQVIFGEGDYHDRRGPVVFDGVRMVPFAAPEGEASVPAVSPDGTVAWSMRVALPDGGTRWEVWFFDGRTAPRRVDVANDAPGDARHIDDQSQIVVWRDAQGRDSVAWRRRYTYPADIGLGNANAAFDILRWSDGDGVDIVASQLVPGDSIRPDEYRFGYAGDDVAYSTERYNEPGYAPLRHSEIFLGADLDPVGDPRGAWAPCSLDDSGNEPSGATTPYADADLGYSEVTLTLAESGILAWNGFNACVGYDEPRRDRIYVSEGGGAPIALDESDRFDSFDPSLIARRTGLFAFLRNDTNDYYTASDLRLYEPFGGAAGVHTIARLEPGSAPDDVAVSPGGVVIWTDSDPISYGSVFVNLFDGRVGGTGARGVISLGGAGTGPRVSDTGVAWIKYDGAFPKLDFLELARAQSEHVASSNIRLLGAPDNNRTQTSGLHILAEPYEDPWRARQVILLARPVTAAIASMRTSYTIFTDLYAALVASGQRGTAARAKTLLVRADLVAAEALAESRPAAAAALLRGLASRVAALDRSPRLHEITLAVAARAREIADALVPPPPPANDVRAGAMTIGALPAVIVEDTRRATRSDDDPATCAWSNENSVWFRYKPTKKTRLVIETVGSNYDTVLSVLRGTALAPVACNNDRRDETSRVIFTAQKNETYFIVVSAVDDVALGGDLRLSVAVPPAAPANDLPSGALALGPVPFSISEDTQWADVASSEPASCAGSETNTVFFLFTPAITGWYEFETLGSDFDTYLTLYRDVAGGPPDVVACNNNDGYQQTSRLRFPATAGTRYLLKASDVAATLGGNLVLNGRAVAPPPDNDEPEGARPIALGESVTEDTESATLAPNEYIPCVSGAGATVWYRFSQPTAALVLADTSSSGFDTVMAVYRDDGGTRVLVDCNNQVGYTYWAKSRFSAEAGKTYYLQIGNAQASIGGALALTLREVVPPPNDTLAGAKLISSLPYSDTQPISEATTSNEDPQFACGYGIAGSIWYRYVAAGSGRLVTRTVGDSLALGVFDGESGPATALGCTSGYPRDVVFEVVAGRTYWIIVTRPTYGQSDSATLQLDALTAPPNDELAAASVVTALPFIQDWDSRTATAGADDSASCDGVSGPSVWFAFTATDSAQVTFRGSYDLATIAVLTGSAGSFSELGCSFDYGPSVTLSAPIIGQTYYVMMRVPEWATLGASTFIAQSP